jgi:hypothetical protein
MRRKMKKPMTAGAERLVIRKLEGLKEMGYSPNSLLEEAIMRNWLTVYAPKELPRSPALQGPPPRPTYITASEADILKAEKDFYADNLKGGFCAFCGLPVRFSPGLGGKPTTIPLPCGCGAFKEGLKKLEGAHV